MATPETPKPSGIFGIFAAKLFEKLWPYLEKKLDEFTPIITEKLLALLPLLVATATKTVTDEILKKFSGILDADPDIPFISDVFDLSETIRQGVNGSVPDIDIPILSDIFDLTEMFNRQK